MRKYGYFDNDAREYVLTDPRTPTKWINYVGTLRFGGFVDTTGGLLICKGDPALNRITKYLPQLPDCDLKGSTVYLRKKEGEGFKVFSPLFVPTLNDYEKFEARIGLGYTRFVNEAYGVKTEITIFVPDGAQTLIEDIRVTNISDSEMSLDVVPVVEYTHFDALRQFTNADWVPQTMQSWEVQQGRYTLLAQAAFMKRGFAENYLTSNHPVDSFESDRKAFLGDNGYGGWRNPRSLHSEHLGNSEALRGDNVGVLLHRLGSLAPGESQRVIVQLGQQPEAAAASEVSRYRDPNAVDQAFASLSEFWDGYLKAYQVTTPDEATNTMLNVWNPRQVFITKQWSRYLSLYQLGFGARGIGFRDSSQDVIGVISSDPEGGRELIEQLLHVQKRNGSAMHQFNPMTMVANEGDSREMEDRPHYYGDDHLWIVLAVSQYLRETGNLSFLDKVIPFYEKGKDGKPIEVGTVREHLRRAIEFTRTDLGAHGLPLLGFADWNDTINLPAGAESVFVASLYGRALKEMMALAEFEGDSEALEDYRKSWELMRDTVNSQAWDRDWYIRYFDFDGQPLGSITNPNGKIFVNAQSWPVLCGFATPERGVKSLDSVRERLNTKYGIKLSTPGFDHFDPSKGGVTTFPPGAKENGGIFLHTNPWMIIAETLIGRGDYAFEYYSQLLPASKNEILDIYEIEPFVYAQNILGDEHPQFGLGRNSWLSGTASWMYTAATQFLLGIRPEHEGLVVDPCIPPSWPGFSVTRRFRGAIYNIVVENPDHVSKGVQRMEIDGDSVEGNVIPPVSGGTVSVRVIMG